MAHRHADSIYDTYITTLEGVDLRGLIRHEPRIRRWLARQLDEETLDYLLPTLKDVAATLGVNAETVRRYAEDPAIGLTPSLPASAVRFHRHDLQVLVVQRAEREPAIGGLRRWRAPDTTQSEALLEQALADGSYDELEAGAPIGAARIALSSVRGAAEDGLRETLARARAMAAAPVEPEELVVEDDEFDAAMTQGRYAGLEDDDDRRRRLGAFYRSRAADRMEG